jgi:hypothetical protein
MEALGTLVALVQVIGGAAWIDRFVRTERLIRAAYTAQLLTIGEYAYANETVPITIRNPLKKVNKLKSLLVEKVLTPKEKEILTRQVGA